MTQLAGTALVEVPLAVRQHPGKATDGGTGGGTGTGRPAPTWASPWLCNATSARLFAKSGKPVLNSAKVTCGALRPSQLLTCAARNLATFDSD